MSEMGPTGGGVEVWLASVSRRIDRERFRMDFLVHTPHPRAFDDEMRSLGSRVVPCVRPLLFWRYPGEFRRRLAELGPFDVVHSHVLFGGLVTRLARRNGIPVRIAHSHSDTRGLAVDGDLLRGPIVRFTTRWARTDSTCRLACSRRAGEAMFGSRAGAPGADWRFVPYGLDLAPFERPVDRFAVRAELGLPADALVVGHVGRFQAQKNHDFLVEIARAAADREPRVRFLLIGDGPLRPRIEARVRELGLGEVVRFLGVRHDVPRILVGALDRFLLPSHYEGLPIVGLEAQAAGLPSIVTDVIAEELDVVPRLVRRISLREPAAVWAAAVLASGDSAATPEASLAAMRASPFEIGNSVRELERIYSSCCDGAASSPPS